jgi:hypothetical protein
MLHSLAELAFVCALLFAIYAIVSTFGDAS